MYSYPMPGPSPSAASFWTRHKPLENSESVFWVHVIFHWSKTREICTWVRYKCLKGFQKRLGARAQPIGHSISSKHYQLSAAPNTSGSNQQLQTNESWRLGMGILQGKLPNLGSMSTRYSPQPFLVCDKYSLRPGVTQRVYPVTLRLGVT